MGSEGMSVWIDLTDFLKWTGNLTGIQRIQYNLSKKYIQSNKEVHFFIYNEAVRKFEEVQFDPEQVVSSGIVRYSKAAVTETTFLRRYPILQRVSGKLARLRKDKDRPVSRDCPFVDGDTVLVMGGIWVGTFINDMETCKLRENFIFIHFAFDMIPTLFPGYVVDWLPDAFSTYQKKVFGIAEGIISISDSTKKDVLQFIKDNDIENFPKIQTVRIGEDINLDDNLIPSNNVLRLEGQQFILSVSTFEARKNHAALFYVLKEAKRRGIVLPKIVIAGRNGWLTDDIRYMISHDPEASSEIILMNNVDDNDLDWLYKNCRFTVFPSFYEGWGMPVAESLSYGKLCLSSDTSSMPEIAGDLVEYFSPYDTGAMLNLISKYLDDGLLRDRQDLIKKNYHITSWEDMFLQVSSFVDEV